MRVGWGRNNPVFRQVFTSRFVPDATDEQLAWFNELCLQDGVRRNAATLFASRSEIDVARSAPPGSGPDAGHPCSRRRGCPTCRRAVSSRRGIPDAQFVELDSSNHILLEHEPAWPRFWRRSWSSRACTREPAGEDPAFASLSAREREILALMADGLGNAEIAERLSISEKTVRNHVSNVFDKLGVWTRAQAIVFARDRHFVERAESIGGATGGRRRRIPLASPPLAPCIGGDAGVHQEGLDG